MPQRQYRHLSTMLADSYYHLGSLRHKNLLDKTLSRKHLAVDTHRSRCYCRDKRADRYRRTGFVAE